MNKQTKMLLGLAVVGGVGYYAYTQFKKSNTKSFAKKPKRKKSKASPNPSAPVGPYEYSPFPL
jgi:uncharacterized membrane protein YebE (DUF533 family)